MMKQFKINMMYGVVALALTSLYGCGGAGEADPANIPVTLDTTAADISGSAVKGTLRNAKVTVSQLNGSAITIGSGDRTGNNGKVAFSVTAKEGFGLNSMLKVQVLADAQSSMVCDAVKCGTVALGDVVSGAALTGTSFTTLTWVQMPYASKSDGVVDARFQANALTTVASKLVAADVAAGRNVSVRPLYEMALADNSALLLKALGVAVKANVFTTDLVSAETYQNMVTGETCDKGVCKDTLVAPDIIKLSLLNAAFAAIGEGENFNQLMNDVAAAIPLAQEGDVTVLNPLRERMLAAISGLPYLAKVGLKAEDVVDLKLAFIDAAVSSGPVREITTDAVVASAVITGSNRISAAEAEAMAFDVNNNTKWLDHNDWKGAPSVAKPSWVQVKFAEPQAVNALVLTSANDAPARDPENFQVLASNDGTNWVTLAEFIGESFDKRFERKQFRFVNGLEFSYYRLNITKNKGDDTLMQVAEIEFVGPVYTSADHTDPVGTGVITARNRIGAGEAETKAFDNDVNTKWLDHNDWKGAPTAANPAWVQIDLPEAKAVDTLVLTSANDSPARDPENFNLQGSNDGGKTWTTLSAYIGESFDKRFERKQFSVANSLAWKSVV